MICYLISNGSIRKWIMAPNEEEAKRLFILRMVIDQQPRENIKCLEVS